MRRDDLLEVDRLRKVFEVRGPDGRWTDFVAVDDVSLRLPRGGSLAVVGESGSGKTTVARILAGLETRTAGDVVFDGREWTAPERVRERRRHARRVQMVFQNPFESLDPRQTLGAALMEILRLHRPSKSGAWRLARALELLDLVGLDGGHLDRLPSALSGGQRQRFAIGRALAMEPELLILDEAVSALDVSVQAQILNLLISLRKETGISYFFVSHDLAVVRQVSDTIVVMHRGRVVESGATATVMDAPQHEYTQRLLAAIPTPTWGGQESQQ